MIGISDGCDATLLSGSRQRSAAQRSLVQSADAATQPQQAKQSTASVALRHDAALMQEQSHDSHFAFGRRRPHDSFMQCSPAERNVDARRHVDASLPRQPR